MAVFQNNLLAGAGAQSSGGAVHKIDQSIRFNDDDSPALNKTYSGAGSRVKFTYSCWLKVATTDTGSGFPLFNGGTGTSDTTWSGVSYYQGMIYAQGYSTNWRITTRKLRDPAAWYHIVYVWDTGQVADTERIKIFINGVRETEFSTFNHPAKDAQSGIGQASQQHTIGYQSRTVGWGYADAYLADMVYLDGTAADPSSFAEYNENGIWVPKDVSGLTFGTNGFHIDGRDSADLGDDESGQGNDYTSTGLAAHDQVSDSPTNNFCVVNPLYRGTATTVAAYGTLANGNLEFSYTNANNAGQLCTELFTSGKWYWEMRMVAGGGSSSYFNSSGIAAVNDGYVKSDTNMHGTVAGEIGFNSYNGECKAFGSLTKTYTEVPFVDGDILQVAVDADNGAIYYGKNGTFMGSGDPTSGASKTNAGATWTPSSYSGGWVPTVGALGGSVPKVMMNFGQEGTFAGGTTAGNNSDGNSVGNFKYSVPSGYLAICTKNLGAE